MLVMRAIEGLVNSLGQLVSAEKTTGLHYPALAVDHLGSIGLSHGLCSGKSSL